MPPVLEQSGWKYIDISHPALDRVEEQLTELGVPTEDFSVAPHLAGFEAHLQLEEYAGEYRIYGGPNHHCLLEKSLEHYLSLAIAQPMPGQTAVDIGSCKSVVPGMLRRLHDVRCYEQDLVYPAGVHGDRIGSSAASIPLPNASVDFMMLHCTFEHFEGDADTAYVRECARLLKPGGRTIILPLYLNANHCNITGETDANIHEKIGFDTEARYYCLIPEWQNRFGRHYSPDALLRRVINPAREAGLIPQLFRCVKWETIDPRLWLRWILVLERPSAI